MVYDIVLTTLDSTRYMVVVGPRRTNDSPLSEAAKLKKALMRDGKVARQPFRGIAVDFLKRNMGVSENNVPLIPMVFMIIIPFLNGYFIGNIPYFQTNPHDPRMTLPCLLGELFMRQSFQRARASEDNS